MILFNLEIHLSSIIYVLILFILIILVSINIITKWELKSKSYYVRFFLLLLAGLIYNIVEELFPNSNLPIDLSAQYIISYTVGLASAFYFLFYLKSEYKLEFIKPFNVVIIGSFSFLILICCFIIPYIITKSLTISRSLFLTIILALLLLTVFSVLKNQYLQFKSFKGKYLKLHSINGAIGYLSIISLPITILASGGSQFIVQTCYTMGFFFITIDYFFYGLRKKETKNNISFAHLTVRETEILNMLLEDPNLKYTELSQALNISEGTLSAHLSNIYKKLGIKNKKGIKEMSKSYRDALDV